MVWQHHQPRVVVGDEGHHHVVVGQRCAILPLGVAGLLVVARGLVPVMSVGQKHRAISKKLGDGSNVAGCRNAPHGRGRAVLVEGVYLRRGRRYTLEDRAQLVVGITVQRHDGADVGRYRLHQRHPVADGGGLGELVGQHLASVVVLDAHAGDESEPRALLAVQLESVAQEVIGGFGLLLQYAFAQPLFEPLRRFGVAACRVRRPVQPLAGLQVNDVQRVPVHQRLLDLGCDQVVGRAQHGGHIADHRRVVPPPPKGNHICHTFTLLARIGRGSLFRK